MSEYTVFVDSRGGNTRKVAEAIAGEIGGSIGNMGGSLPDDATIIFLGSGVYGGKPGDAMKKFIESGNFSGRKVALFATSGGEAGAKNMMAMMADAVIQKGGTILGDYHCRGKFLFTNRGHPSEEDLANAKKFARDMIAKT